MNTLDECRAMFARGGTKLKKTKQVECSCGSLFLTYNGAIGSKYCSPDCRKEARKVALKNFLSRNPGYMLRKRKEFHTRKIMKK